MNSPLLLSRKMILIVSAIMAIGILSVVCSTSEPEDVVIELSITQGKLQRDTNVIKVKQNDRVTFRITSDEGGIVHLHGYNLKAAVGPDKGEEGILAFTATATGAYTFTLHKDMVHVDSEETQEHGHGEQDESDREDEVTLGTLQVYPR